MSRQLGYCRVHDQGVHSVGDECIYCGQVNPDARCQSMDGKHQCEQIKNHRPVLHTFGSWEWVSGKQGQTVEETEMWTYSLAALPRPKICRWCHLALIGDDSGGWLHDTPRASRECPTTYAEPADEPRATFA